MIHDPRRIINFDETPQPVNMPSKGSRKKVAKLMGYKAKKRMFLNKDSVTLGVCWDASGFNYGLQILLKGEHHKHINSYPRLATDQRSFDNAIDLQHYQSRYMIIDTTQKGMQTCASFLEWMKWLKEQIQARSEAEVARGGTRIELPVVVMLDNHASRFSKEVLEASNGAAPPLGIRLFTEPPNTSGFLQALDQ